MKKPDLALMGPRQFPADEVEEVLEVMKTMHGTLELATKTHMDPEATQDTKSRN
jgi:hypothetical protein